MPMDGAGGKITLLPMPAVVGRTYRVDRARTERVASYVSVYDDGSAYCYACRRRRCRHVAAVLTRGSPDAARPGDSPAEAGQAARPAVGR